MDNNISGIIIFDIDDTLFLTTKFVNYARGKSFESIIRNSKIPLNIQTLSEDFEEVYKLLGSNSTKHYDILLKKYDFSQSEIDRLVSIAVISYHDAKLEISNFLPQNIFLLLENLINNNYILGIISSGVGVKQWDKLYRTGLYKYFEPENVFITGSMNYDTKNFDLYSNVKQILNLKYNFNNSNLNPIQNENQIFYVGDREEKDIIPAKDAGFKTIRIKGFGKYSFDYENSCADYKFEKICDIKEIFNLNTNFN